MSERGWPGTRYWESLRGTVGRGKAPARLLSQREPRRLEVSKSPKNCDSSGSKRSFLSTKSAVTFIAVFALFCFFNPLSFSYAIISGENLLED